MSERMTRLDAVRVMAMGWVLLHHADDYGSVQYLRATPLLATLDDWVTLAALAALFALSGFLTQRYSASDETNALTYLKRRAFRLYPPFAIALAVSSALGVIPLSNADFIVNLASLGPLSGRAAPTVWFVEVLVFYSLAFAGWLSVKQLRPRPWTLPLTMGIVTALAGVVASVAGLVTDARVFGYLPAFSVAAAAGAATRFAQSRSRFYRELLAAGACGSGVAALLAVLPFGASISVRNLTVSLVVAALVPALAIGAQDRGRVPKTGARLLALAATGSYATYLVHRIAFWGIVGLSARLHIGSAFPLLVASIPLLFVVGALLQRPYDALLKKAIRPSARPAMSTSATE